MFIRHSLGGEPLDVNLLKALLKATTALLG